MYGKVVYKLHLHNSQRYNISILRAADCLLRSQPFFSLSRNSQHLIEPEVYNGTLAVRCEEDRGSVRE